MKKGRTIKKRRKAKVIGEISSNPNLRSVKEEPHKKTTDTSIKALFNFMNAPFYSARFQLVKA